MKWLFGTVLAGLIGLSSGSGVKDEQPKTLVDTIFVTERNPFKPPAPVEDIYDVFDSVAVAVLTNYETIRASIPSNLLTISLEARPGYRPSRDLCGFEVDEEGRHLTDEEADELVSLLLDETNYEYAQYPCIFSPDYAFTFESDTDTVTVLLATGCLFIRLCDGEELFGFATVKQSRNNPFALFSLDIWGRRPGRGYN